jgi:hypothetical protein
MNMSVVLFQVDDDRFSALAFDIGHQGNIWKNRYNSRGELVHSLKKAGLVTADEVEYLQDGACFAKGSPVLRASIDREAIEGAGFKRVVSERSN